MRKISPMQRPDPPVVGWDIGGAHVKACVLRQGEVLAVAQWPCPLWQGLDQLERTLALAHARWPGLAQARHAVTMTGEMVDLFEHREHGVSRLVATLHDALAPTPAALRFYAGDAGWCDAAAAAREWRAVASANWLATARHAAAALGPGDALLVDIGSTTTDLIALRDGKVVTRARSDHDRLATGELVYQGVVRTPLCAIARRIAWRGVELNVMNEFFATSADVYRLTGELDPLHDQHPSADGAAKDTAATRQRLARMIGLDARDAPAHEWLANAHAWRAAQLAELRGQLDRVRALHGLAGTTTLVGAGCGDFLLADLAPAAARCIGYAGQVARIAAAAESGAQRWAQVCAPSVAVAALYEREHCR
jgi:probable H4MPT-linked C1 transfer pathway protein